MFNRTISERGICGLKERLRMQDTRNRLKKKELEENLKKEIVGLAQVLPLVERRSALPIEKK